MVVDRARYLRWVAATSNLNEKNENQIHLRRLIKYSESKYYFEVQKIEESNFDISKILMLLQI